MWKEYLHLSHSLRHIFVPTRLRFTVLMCYFFSCKSRYSGCVNYRGLVLLPPGTSTGLIREIFSKVDSISSFSFNYRGVTATSLILLRFSLLRHCFTVDKSVANFCFFMPCSRLLKLIISLSKVN